jgi:hypothetical protein
MFRPELFSMLSLRRAPRLIRLVHTSPRPPPRPRPRVLVLAGATLLAGAALVPTAGPGAEIQVQQQTQTQTPLLVLLRSYFVYSLISIPALVDNSPQILSVLTSIPGLKQITEAIIRVTVFPQVGSYTHTYAPLCLNMRFSLWEVKQPMRHYPSFIACAQRTKACYSRIV